MPLPRFCISAPSAHRATAGTVTVPPARYCNSAWVVAGLREAAFARKNVVMADKHDGKWRARWFDERDLRHSRNFDTQREAKTFEARKKPRSPIRAGLRSATPLARTFSEFAERWLSTRALEKRSRRDDISILKEHLLPTLGTMALSVGPDVPRSGGEEAVPVPDRGEGFSAWLQWANRYAEQLV